MPSYTKFYRDGRKVEFFVCKLHAPKLYFKSEQEYDLHVETVHLDRNPAHNRRLSSAFDEYRPRRFAP
jgi:hypothetical protein